MRVLIIENELYLAQSIANKLSELGYSCELVNSTAQIKANIRYDVLLLSTNVLGFERLISHNKQAVIILMVSYISVDTVVEPLRMGASDYIQKPFMVEELVRKIKHHQHYKELNLINKAYNDYISSKLSSIKLANFNYKKIKPPFVLKTHKQINADAFVFNYIKAHSLSFSCVDLQEFELSEKLLRTMSKNQLLFIMNYQCLKNEDQKNWLKEFDKKTVIIHSSSELENCELLTLDLNDAEKDLSNNEILTIDEYVRYVIINYQNTLPDTDLSKKLGISRKSLWEKRKKYGLTKKR